MCCTTPLCFFFFNDTATTEIYTLSLHDALPISADRERPSRRGAGRAGRRGPILRPVLVGPPAVSWPGADGQRRSEEHTSELQSRQYLVCRLLLEKKKKNHISLNHSVYAVNISEI